MENQKMGRHSQKAFIYATIGVGLFLLFIIITLLYRNSTSDLISISIGLLVIIIGTMGILGSIKSVQSFGEPNNLKKVLAAIINFSFTTLFIFSILANIKDILFFISG